MRRSHGGAYSTVITRRHWVLADLLITGCHDREWCDGRHDCAFCRTHSAASRARFKPRRHGRGNTRPAAFKKDLRPEIVDKISREFSISGNVHSVTCRAALAWYLKTNWKIDLTGNNNNGWLYFDVLNKEALQEVKCLEKLFEE